VRATTFRVLATIPGVSLAGKVTDPLGRTGYGIALDTGTGPGSTGGQEEVLVIAPGTGTFRTDEYVVTSLPAGVSAAPASGALPGPVTCPAGTKAYAFKESNWCFRGCRMTSIGGRDHRDPGIPGTGPGGRGLRGAGWTSVARTSPERHPRT
jgi:hypothetical protein